MTTAAPFGPGSNPGVDLPPALSRFAIRSTAAGPIFASVEFLFLSLAPYLGSLTYHGIVMPLHLPPDHLMLTVGVVMASLYILMSHPRGSFDLDELKSVSLRGPLVQWSLAFMFFTMASFALKIGDVFSRGGILTGFVMGASAIVILRLAVPITVRMANQYRLLEGRRAVLLSDGAPTPGAMTPRDLDAAGYAVQSWFRVPALGQQQTPAQVERLCSDIVKATRQQRVEEIVLVADAFRQPLIADILDRLRVVPLRVLLLRSPEARSQPQHTVGRRIKLSAIEVQAAPLSRGEWFAKRCLDVTAATALLLLTSPVLAAIAIMIRLDSKGPILFRQTRVGYAGRTFMIFKFRSM